jgi:hypothetical protein
VPGDYALVTKLREGEPFPDAPKGMSPSVAASQSYNQTTCMFREMAGTEHQVLNHCPKSAAANLPLCWLLVPEVFLTNHPKEVVSDHRKFQYQGIGSKLPGRKTFDIHIRLKFAVVLFAFPMGMVRSEDIIV